MRYAIAYIATAVVFLVADMIWLGIVAKNFYRDNLDGLLLEQPSIPVAAAFYALYVVGVIIFAVAPALREETWVTAAIYGALFGFFACFFAVHTIDQITHLLEHTARGDAVGLVERDLLCAAALGFATPLLPCGPLYFLIALALLAGSAARGAEMMLAFGLGTVPLLWLAQAQFHWVRRRLSPLWLNRTRVALALVAAATIGWRLRATLGLPGPDPFGFVCQ